MKQDQKTTFTPSKFASLIGCDRHELQKKLSEINAKPAASNGRGEEYSLRDLVKAHLGGDIRREQLRKTREEADKLAIANARTRGELVEIAAVKKLGEKFMIALRQRILSFPITNEEKDRCLGEIVALKDVDWSRQP